MADYYSLNSKNHQTDAHSLQNQHHSKSHYMCKRHSNQNQDASLHFKPKINQKSNSLQRNLSDLFKWKEIKETRNVMLKRYFDMQHGLKHKIINPISDEISKFSRPANLPVEQILLEKGNERNLKLRQKEQQLYGQQNIPSICGKSKKLKRDMPVFERLYGLTPQKSQQLRESKSVHKLQSPLSSNQSLRQLLTEKRGSEQQVQFSSMLLAKFKQKQEEKDENKQEEKKQEEVKEVEKTLVERLLEKQEKLVEKDRKVVEERKEIKECFVSLVEVQRKLAKEEKENREVNVEQSEMSLAKVYRYILDQD